MKYPAPRGFTLIELLVVIAIIGVLASIVLAALGSSRVKARDGNRLEEVHQLQTALELYASSNNGNYPGAANQWYDNTCSAGGGAYPDINPLLTGYLALSPDPNGAGCIWYIRYTTGGYEIEMLPEDPTTALKGLSCDAGYYCVQG